ncbi:iron export ABC transporter permease subunit FetB [uncultured Turicimonas sp.]|uniref:ABC transporter permease n=1 Tax=uncultured Turicimonas sp. TaxID=1918607 RepID=UPI00280530F3|nr:iron export ABC transporter permease subunit FetB [uncultured Turicimonas sp.]
MSTTLGSIEISYAQMAIGMVPLGIVILLSAVYRLELIKSLVIAVVRACIQLGIMGYLLVWVFAQDNPWVISLLLIIMVAFASQASERALKGIASKKIKFKIIKILFISIALGALSVLCYLQFVVVRPEPLWEGKYIIPLGGMLIAQSMVAGSLAVERLRSEFEARADEIETLLALGATSAEASRESVKVAMTAALMPIINSMMVLGIVALPGMMSGQILAGVSPLLAVRYQLLIFFCIAASAALVSWLSIRMVRSLFFTRDDQFIRLESLQN